MSAQETARSGRSPGFWAGLYLAVVAMIGALKITDAINGPTGFILMAASCGLLIPMVRAQNRGDCSSAATLAYNKRVIASSFGYVLGLGLAITVWRNYELSAPAVFAISLLPVLPTFGIIWAMARYLSDETDEYLRHRTIMASIHGLGLVLSVGILWGFLEMFELVPHVWAWWVLPAWAIGTGLSNLWQKVPGE
ncbi:hypothetical protein GRI42_10830 [Erythrobacter gaetbuli]|uniref:Uncharacterized protein n=1 Tax=Qipengyuania gaetbuli TaxID=266952 RepID=A0A844Y1U0_9SPHN|nr:hypothetical protein [Qipengyuania gaetbuli]MXO51796.1 hypothetical protein [Qipengyuania gaetbuli]